MKTSSVYSVSNYQSTEVEIARLKSQAKASSEEMQLLKNSRLPVQGEILDVGCGPGFYAEKISTFFPNIKICGLDNDPIVLNEAKKRISAIQGDARALPFAANQFDGALIRLVLRHISSPIQAVAELFRVVKPGGIVIAIDSDNSMWALEPVPKFFTEVFSAHQRTSEKYGADPFIGRKLYKIMRTVGFTDVQVQPFSLTSSEIGVSNFAYIILSAVMGGIDPDMLDKTILESAYQNVIEWSKHKDSFGAVTAFMVSGVVPESV